MAGLSRTRRFSAADEDRVARAADRAEALTSGFYCIPGREWRRLAWSLTTLRDGPGPDAPVFADVVRTPRRTWRIRLRDDVLLEAVHGRGDGVRLDPLLLYVLTHELIHVVRFGGGLAPYEAPDLQRATEEARVHALTRRVLEEAGPEVPGLARVLEVYRAAASP